MEPHSFFTSGSPEGLPLLLLPGLSFRAESGAGLMKIFSQNQINQGGRHIEKMADQHKERFMIKSAASALKKTGLRADVSKQAATAIFQTGERA